MLLCKLLAVIFIPLWGLQWEASLFYNIINYYCCDDVCREDLISSWATAIFLYFCWTLPYKEQQMCSQGLELDLFDSWLYLGNVYRYCFVWFVDTFSCRIGQYVGICDWSFLLNLWLHICMFFFGLFSHDPCVCMRTKTTFGWFYLKTYWLLFVYVLI